MAPNTATPITVAGKHILKVCRQGSIASARLPYCRASTHTTLIGPQLFPSKHTLRQPGGAYYSSVTPRAVVSFRQRMAAQNAAPLVWIDCEVKTSPPNRARLVTPRSWQQQYSQRNADDRPRLQ